MSYHILHNEDMFFSLIFRSTIIRIKINKLSLSNTTTTKHNIIQGYQT